MKKCIVFTAYNRPQYLEKTLEKWLNVDLINEQDIYFSIDPSGQIHRIIELITDFKNKINANVYIHTNEELYGCAKNTWSVIDRAFEQYDFVIVAEDDIFPSKDVLKYFDYLINKYNNDEQVAVICTNYEKDDWDQTKISRYEGFRVQIWGTWKEMWNKYIKDTWDFDYSTGVNGGPSGWDWNLTLRVIPNNNIKSIVPHSSRSQHMGELGVHCNPDIFESTQYKSFREDYSWDELVEV